MQIQYILFFIAGATFLQASESMETLGNKHNTDKIYKHSYHQIYEDVLTPLRDQTFHMLEIGVLRGASVRMWQDYFPHAQIHGLDTHLRIEPEERIHLYQGNVRNHAFLAAVLQAIGHPLTFILDDASHIPEDQLDSFLYLFEHALESGGIYIVEDVETSYWKEGPPFHLGLHHKKNIVEFFKRIPDFLNREYAPAKDQKTILRSIVPPEAGRVLKSIKSVTFARNCIIIRKK